MNISRLFIRNFRNFELLDIRLRSGITCVTGENNCGKSNFLYALRLILDSKLGSAVRQLTPADFHCSLDLSLPTQIIIAAEFANVSSEDSAQLAFAGPATLSGWGPTMAYRFRPNQLIREQIDEATLEYHGAPLRVDDYEYELVWCDASDPTTVKWYEKLGRSIRQAFLQHFTLEALQALRDVEHDLRQARSSPLEKLINLTSVPLADQQTIESAFVGANSALQAVPTIEHLSEGIRSTFQVLAGDAVGLDAQIGAVDPAFSKLARTLTMLFDGSYVGTLDLSRNGLGVNNLLYVSMIAEYFRRRIDSSASPGQLLLVDEPEAHLHPQAQRVLYSALEQMGFQTIVATHSVHIASQASLVDHVSLTRSAAATSASNLTLRLSTSEVADLDRYLDATRSSLLLARRVILVEGPAELFLLPVLARAVLGVDLDRHFVSIVPIYGTHFEVFAKLFGDGALEKNCAIITDGDAPTSPPTDDDTKLLASEPRRDLRALENRYVKVFANRTTFERALVVRGMLPSLIAAVAELNHPKKAHQLEAAMSIDDEAFEKAAEMGALGQAVLSTAIYHGKARFAQVLSRHVASAKEMPTYLADAIQWVLTDNSAGAKT